MRREMKDQFGREIDYMRISVTDRCNFRCRYCMPPEGVEAVGHDEILRFEEMLEIAGIAAELGIRKLRVTGGEPFVRRGILEFLEKLVQVPGIDEVSVTTNGSMLEEYLPELKRIGIRGINISLDAMDRQRFKEITGRDELFAVLRGIRQASALNFPRVKVNCVPMRGVNEADLQEIAGLARDYPVDVRFIELMPLGMGRDLRMIPQAEVVQRLEAAYGSFHFYHKGISAGENTSFPAALQECGRSRGGGPAVYGHFSGFQGDVGFISALSHEFCSSCSRIRLLADGGLKACLNYESRINLRDLLRSGIPREEIKEIIAQAIRDKPARHGFFPDGSEPGRQEEETRERRGMFSIGG